MNDIKGKKKKREEIGLEMERREKQKSSQAEALSVAEDRYGGKQDGLRTFSIHRSRQQT